MFGNALDNMLSQYRSPSNPPVNSPTPGASTNSFFSAASPITAGANSTGASPFGALIPDLSRATPEQLKYIQSTLAGLTYDAPAGGYINRNTNYGNTVFGPRGYYNREVRLPDQPQLDASNLYNLIGSFATKPIGTPALNALPGYSPSQRPSYNTQLGGSYGGPYAFPNWRNG